MQIVWHGHRLLDVIHGVQLGNYGILKTSALVTVNMGWDADTSLYLYYCMASV